MWTYHRQTMREWDLKVHLETGWERRFYDLGDYALYEVWFTPEGWFLSNGTGGRHYADYHLHLIHDGHYIERYPLTFDEFENFPSMRRGFFIPF